MTTRRIYMVHNDSEDETQLIRATNPAQAIRHAARGMFTAKAASAEDLAALAVAGAIKVEDAVEAE